MGSNSPASQHQPPLFGSQAYNRNQASLSGHSDLSQYAGFNAASTIPPKAYVAPPAPQSEASGFQMPYNPPKSWTASQPHGFYDASNPPLAPQASFTARRPSDPAPSSQYTPQRGLGYPEGYPPYFAPQLNSAHQGAASFRQPLLRSPPYHHPPDTYGQGYSPFQSSQQPLESWQQYQQQQYQQQQQPFQQPQQQQQPPFQQQQQQYQQQLQQQQQQFQPPPSFQQQSAQQLQHHGMAPPQPSVSSQPSQRPQHFQQSQPPLRPHAAPPPSHFHQPNSQSTLSQLPLQALQQQQYTQLQQPQQTTQSQPQSSSQSADALTFDMEALTLRPPTVEEYTTFANNLQSNLETHVEVTDKRFGTHEGFLNWVRYTIEDLAKKLVSVTGSMKQYQGEADGYREEVNEMRDDIRRLTAEMRGHKEQGQKSQTEVRSLRKEVKKLSSQVAALIKERDNFKQRWIEVQDELDLMLNWVAFKDNAEMFSAINFRALLDFFQGFISLYARISQQNIPASPPLYANGAASLEFRENLDTYEKEQRDSKQDQTQSNEWSAAESLAVRMARTRMIITIAGNNRPELLALLQSESVLKLLAEKRSNIRTWGNASAHQIIKQSSVLEQMVSECASRLQSHEVNGLLHMIQVLRPDLDN